MTRHCTQEVFRGSIFNDGQVAQEAEVRNPAQESLPDLWPASRLPGEVQDVPIVFPAIGSQGRDPGSGEVELVAWKLASVTQCGSGGPWQVRDPGNSDLAGMACAPSN